MVQLPIETFRSRSTYGQLAEELDLALNANGYIERSYYGVGDASDNADGFVVVTRMERIYRNGQSFKGPDRWILGDPSLNTISAYLARIANTDEGYFRVVAFVFTNQPFRTDLKDVVTANAATDWLYDGMTSLPSEVAGRSTPPSTECTALIYEFRKEHGSPPDYDIPSLVGAQQHLTGSGILAALSLVPGGSK